MALFSRDLLVDRLLSTIMKMPKKYDLNTNVKNFNGVLLESIEKDGPAMKAGLKPGDIIIKLNSTEINSQSAFEEELSYHYPGDKITLSYLREWQIANHITYLGESEWDYRDYQTKHFQQRSIGCTTGSNTIWC